MIHVHGYVANQELVKGFYHEMQYLIYQLIATKSMIQLHAHTDRVDQTSLYKIYCIDIRSIGIYTYIHTNIYIRLKFSLRQLMQALIQVIVCNLDCGVYQVENPKTSI